MRRRVAVIRLRERRVRRFGRHTHLPRSDVHYWRNKRGQEIDLVVPRRGRPPLAIECKASANDFDPRNLRAFHQLYPDGVFRVAAIDVERPFEKTFGDLTVGFRGLAGLMDELIATSGRRREKTTERAG